MRALGIGRRQALHDVAAERNKSVFIRTKGKTMSEENRSCTRLSAHQPSTATAWTFFQIAWTDSESRPRPPDVRIENPRPLQATLFQLGHTLLELEVMVDHGEKARRLRQSTPFAGILTQEERRRTPEKHASAGV
jgi:hypothetical protein